MSSALRVLTRVFAPAKVNLSLHVTGKLDNGYHTLDSLVAFADVGDEILIEPLPDDAQGFEFEVSGPFAGAFKPQDLSARLGASNLVVRAAWALARLSENTPSFKITLVKNLPLGAGLGGGSSDAAACIWGLLEYWGLSPKLEGLDALLLSLGADVPACFACKTLHMRGIGENISMAPEICELPIVLIHPGKPSNTQRVFGAFDMAYGEPCVLPKRLDMPDSLKAFLMETGNMLTGAAVRCVPEIQNVLNALNYQDGLMMARMSGSGSSCFGIFDDETAAEKAAQDIRAQNPDWWVEPCWLGRVMRY